MDVLFLFDLFQAGGATNSPVSLDLGGADHPSFNHLLALLDRQKKIVWRY